MKMGSTQPSRSYLRHVCLIGNLQRGPIQPTTMLLRTKPAYLAFRILLCHPTNFLVQKNPQVCSGHQSRAGNPD